MVISDYVEEIGEKYFKSIVELGLEGVVAKKTGSKYSPGKCVDYWCKFKNRRIDNFIICGYKGHNCSKYLTRISFTLILSFHKFGRISL